MRIGFDAAARRRLLAGVSAAAILWTALPALAAANDPVVLHLPPQPLKSALVAFATQAHLQLVLKDDLVTGRTSPALDGTYAPRDALQRLLAGTGLQFEITDSNAVIVTRPGAASGPKQAGAELAPRIQAARGTDLGGAAAPFSDAPPEEILVTAQKRAQRLQDVPISITALDTRKLEQIGAVDFDSFVRTVPGLIANQAKPGGASFTIRGISTSPLTGNTQSTVATYLDDLPALDSFGAGVSQNPDIRLFDVERVEVLRGPQGTLFGSGALSGAIRIITNKPSLTDYRTKFEATFSSTSGGGRNYDLNAMLNVPVVSGKLGVRAIAYDRRESGYIDNTARNQEDANSLRVYGGRVSALLEPSDGLRITGTALYQRTNAADAPYAMLVGNALTYDSRLPQFKRSELGVFNLAAEYDLGWASLYSSSTYARKVSHGQSDLTDSFGPVLASFGVVPSPLVPYAVNDYGTTFTQEVRLASNANQRFTWLIGGFYKYNAREAHFDVTVPGAGRALSAIGFPDDSIFHADIPVPARELAAFGEVAYKITPTIEATAGLRVFRDKSSYGEHTTGFFNGGETRTSRQTAENSYTPKFALSWKPNADLNFYAQASKGYRVGQSNPAIPNDPVTGLPRGGAYGPDSLWNYELGAKTSWFDNRLIANVAVYYIDWSDIQMDQGTPDGFAYIANIGKAHSVGGEVELTARPLRNVELTSAFSINDARLDTDNAVAGAVKGQRLPGSPRFTISNAAQVSFDFPTGIPGFVRAEHQYIGGQNSDFNPAYNVRYGDYNVVNLRLGAQFGKVETVLFVTNLANDRSNVLASGVGTFWAVRLPPRIVGITLRGDF